MDVCPTTTNYADIAKVVATIPFHRMDFNQIVRYDSLSPGRQLPNAYQPFDWIFSNRFILSDSSNCKQSSSPSIGQRLSSADTVEKLCFTMTGKFVRTFCSRDAHFVNAFSASEALLGGFSCAIYYPLVPRV